MTIVGIDPGKAGAIAVIQERKSTEVPYVKLYDLPLIGKDFNEDAIADILRSYVLLEPHVFIESVHAMPKQGSVSMFNFGKGFGILRGITAALQMRRDFPTPQAWKKELMQGIKEKDESRARAIQLFPHVHKELVLKKHIGRSDALLIAEYGRRLLSRGGNSGNIIGRKTKASKSAA